MSSDGELRVGVLDPASVRALGLLPGGEFRVIVGTGGTDDVSSNTCCVRSEVL